MPNARIALPERSSSNACQHFLRMHRSSSCGSVSAWPDTSFRIGVAISVVAGATMGSPLILSSMTANPMIVYRVGLKKNRSFARKAGSCA